MGLTCSKPSSTLGDLPGGPNNKRWKKKGDAYRLASNAGVPDPEIYHFLQRSVQLTQQYQLALQEQQQQQCSIQEPEEVEGRPAQPKASSSVVLGGQYHLLYKQQQQQQSPKPHHTFDDLVTSTYATTAQQPQEQRPPSKKAQHRLGGSKSATNASSPSTAAMKWPHSQNHKQSIQYTLSLYDIQFCTKLIMRRHGSRPNYEEGHSGTHVYAMRWPMKTRKAATSGEMVILDDMDEFFWFQQQVHRSEWEASTEDDPTPVATAAVVEPPRPLLPPEPTLANSSSVTLSTDHLFHASTMALPPKRKVVDWVTVSAEHKIYVADVGLTMEECNRMVMVTEQQCRGQYAAYTYAKQTLGCREFPLLACTVQDAVHTVVSAILEHCGTPPGMRLALDDREPHMVKYDVTKKERQKLDMHTDKSEWTFLIAISNGAGLDYMGGGTYFECLDATVHVQRGHALIFPGQLRHCGQRIMAGLRFLLVGFLVDKTPVPKAAKETTAVAALVKEEDENETEVIDQDHQRAVLYNVP